MKYRYMDSRQYCAQETVKLLLSHAVQNWGLPQGPRESWPEGYAQVLRVVRALNETYFGTAEPGTRSGWESTGKELA